MLLLFIKLYIRLWHYRRLFVFFAFTCDLCQKRAKLTRCDILSVGVSPYIIILEHMQTEISHRHIQLFEYVVHDVLIAFPRFLVKEEIELEWKARGSRIQLANHI